MVEFGTVRARARVLSWLAMALILGYAALLRFDALSDSFGPHPSPGWLQAVEAGATRVSPSVTPGDWAWQHEADPYAGGDPHNYLRFAREMRHFYQAHVREPVFLAVTRAGLFVTGGADVGISITSIVFSLLVLVAVYLLGREAVSGAAGLLAAAALAIDRDAILWAIGGWRDETFTFFSLTAVWLWLRLARKPTTRSAVIAGTATGLACLTRLTAPFMLAPAVLWILCVRGPVLRRERARLAAIGGLVAGLIVAPYLISCAVVFGDPFYAVNYHTQFYLEREGSTPEIVGAGGYLLDKLVARPVETTDIAIQGLTVVPFQNKWNGLNVWWPGLGTALAWLSVFGLMLWLFSSRGWFLLGVLVGSLVPYMITWSIPGGAEWRFTFHAYAFYLLAAFGLIEALTGLRARVATASHPWRLVAGRAVVVALVSTAGLVWWWGTPPLIAREALGQNRATAIVAGPRDRWLLRRGWSELSVTGNVVARFGRAASSEVVLPLPERRDYELVLRVDPIPRDDVPPQRLLVELNGVMLGSLALTWNPDQVGRYELAVPRALVSAGSNVLRLTPGALVEAGSIVDRYPVLRPEDRVGFRLWHVLIRPVDSGGFVGSRPAADPSRTRGAR